jgi:hypothetical protein
MFALDATVYSGRRWKAAKDFECFAQVYSFCNNRKFACSEDDVRGCRILESQLLRICQSVIDTQGRSETNWVGELPQQFLDHVNQLLVHFSELRGNMVEVRTEKLKNNAK